MNIMIIIGILFLALSLCIMLYGFSNCKDILVSIGSIMLILSLVIAAIISVFEMKKYREEMYTMIENGAEIYLNGQLVDINKIDIRYYHITIKDDCILLSPDD